MDKPDKKLQARGGDMETCGKCMGSGYGGHPDSGALCSDCNGSGVYLDEALAAIAKLGAGDGLVERLNRADEYEPLGHDGWEAADRIAALTAQVAKKDEQLVSVLRREAATYERHDAKMEAAEAERDALRERVARLEGALRKLHHAVCGETGFAACVRLESGKAYPWPALDDADEATRAALTDGGKDG